MPLRDYAYMAFWSRRGVYRTIFLAAWSSGERKRSMPLDDRQITPVLLSASRDLAGAKRAAETAAGIPLKWEAGVLRRWSAFHEKALGFLPSWRPTFWCGHLRRVADSGRRRASVLSREL